MSGSPDSRTSWRSIAGVVAGAGVAIVAGELFFRSIADVRPPLMEAEDAIAWYQAHDPTVLVLGSSHARTFTPLRELMAERRAGREQVAVVPLEYGTMTSYRWLLEHRLRPLMDERKADGTPRRTALRSAVLVTEWWDACGPMHGPASTNLPARSWAFADFVRDLLSNGLTDYNANYLQNRLNRWLEGSVLVRSRGHDHLPEALRRLVKRKSEAEKRADLQGAIDAWRDMVERGAGCEDPVQRQALDDVVRALQARGLDVTLMLFPRMPATLTEKAKQTTLAEFSRWSESFAARHGLRFVDATTGSPLDDDDWEADLDHVTATGSRKFSEWALEGPLRFLMPENAR